MAEVEKLKKGRKVKNKKRDWKRPEINDDRAAGGGRSASIAQGS